MMLIKSIILTFVLCLPCLAAWAAESNDNQDVIADAVDNILGDIRKLGPDALMFGEHYDTSRDYERAFAMMYDASVQFLAYGVNVEAQTSKANVKCGLRLDRHDTQLMYRRNDITRGEATEFETGAKFYLTVTSEW